MLRRKRFIDANEKVWWSCRFTLCIMNGLALLILYLHRVNISLTMVCMVYKPTSSYSDEESNATATKTILSSFYDNTSSFHGDSFTVDSVYSTDNVTSSMTSRYKAEFTWTRSFQGHVLSSYFYGYLSTMFIGGLLSGRFGGKHVLGTGLIVSSIATILIPSAVRLNKYLIIVLRVIIGAASIYAWHPTKCKL